MSIGSTEPKYAMLNNGTQVVVKLFNGPESNLVLFNEYICYRLALLLDIPIPNSGVCIMDGNTNVCKASCADDSNYGNAFYSTFLYKATKLVPSIVNQLINKNDFIKILLFDHIIFNTDRNDGNLLVGFQKNQTRLYAIDHTHVFINQAIWDHSCLERAMAENDLLSKNVLYENNYIYGMFFQNMSINTEMLNKTAEMFKYSIDYDTIATIINDVPSEWRPHQIDEEALLKYLMYRLDNLDVIISMIINYIQNEWRWDYV